MILNILLFSGYNGKNKLDGNNSSRFLYKMDKLLEYSWFPEEVTPILDCLAALRDVKDKCFGWDLEEGWEQAIYNFTSMFAEL